VGGSKRMEKGGRRGGLGKPASGQARIGQRPGFVMLAGSLPASRVAIGYSGLKQGWCGQLWGFSEARDKPPRGRLRGGFGGRNRFAGVQKHFNEGQDQASS